jgi:hypothetical protein
VGAGIDRQRIGERGASQANPVALDDGYALAAEADA